ncbi:MAG: hypothetical protein ACO1SV_22000 [Fimbriimonas sp.]
MVERICRHCGATVLVGLQYCPGCLRPLRTGGEGRDSAVAMEARESRLDRISTKWNEFVVWFTSGAATNPGVKEEVVTTTMSEGYTRVVCPKCQRPHRAPLNQSPSARFVCAGCFHQFPASMAAEFRKGADLNCFQCGVVTFCVNGLRANHCPNCKARVTRTRDPETAKLILLAAFFAVLILVGFGHSVATGTTPQFLLWLGIGTVFTFFGFIVMVALGL